MKHYTQNRKARLAAGIAAATLAFGAAAPAALADVTVSGDDNTSAQFVDASQVQLAVGAQFGDANAAANDGSAAFASNELDITQNQANAGFGSDFDLDGIEDTFDEDDDNDGVFDDFE